MTSTRAGVARVTSLATAAIATLALLAGCSSGTPRYTFHPGGSVSESSPQLRAAKEQAGIETCPHVTARPIVSGGLPPDTLPCLGGGPSVQLSSLRGPLVLNFWAQSCGPCREESPLLQQLFERTRGRLQVIGLDFYDQLPGQAIAFAGQLGIRYPQIADPQGATKAELRVQGLPTTFFIDRTGRIAHRQVGAFTSQSELDAAVQQYLGVSAVARS